jgi:hypothetical protein
MLYPTEETIKMIVKREQPQSNSRTLINIALGFIALVFLYIGIKALWSAYVE